MLALEWNMDDAKQAWFEDGVEQGIKAVAIKMLRKGKSLEEVAEFTDIPIQRLKELANENRDN